MAKQDMVKRNVKTNYKPLNKDKIYFFEDGRNRILTRRAKIRQKKKLKAEKILIEEWD